MREGEQWPPWVECKPRLDFNWKTLVASFCAIQFHCALVIFPHSDLRPSWFCSPAQVLSHGFFFVEFQRRPSWFCSPAQVLSDGFFFVEFQRRLVFLLVRFFSRSTSSSPLAVSMHFISSAHAQERAPVDAASPWFRLSGHALKHAFWSALTVFNQGFDFCARCAERSGNLDFQLSISACAHQICFPVKISRCVLPLCIPVSSSVPHSVDWPTVLDFRLVLPPARAGSCLSR
jgi:hypothetical protein